MNVSRVKLALRKNKTGTFRPLKPGEPIDAGDVIVNDCFYESPSETNIGQPCGERECILRLQFEK